MNEANIAMSNQTQIKEPVVMTARNMVAECANRVSAAGNEIDRVVINLFGELESVEGLDNRKDAPPRQGEVGALLDTIDAMAMELGRLESVVKRLGSELL